MQKTIILFLLLYSVMLNAQQKLSADNIRPKMQWFADVKLGIFIHYGIYAVKGVDESWSFHNKKISWPDYLRQFEVFTASNYNSQQWPA